MARIRVNTEDLKSNAKDFDSAAEAVYRAGEDIAALAAALPSYDGQLSGPARKIGYDIQSRSRDLQKDLAGDAASLRKTAQAFEEVDRQTVSIFTENQAQLDIYNKEILKIKKSHGGDERLGYRWLSDDYVVIWFEGKYLRIHLAVPPLSEADYQSILDFITYIDEYDNYREDMKDALINSWKNAGKGILAVIGAGLITGVPGAAVAALAVLGFVIGDSVDELRALYERIQRFYKAVDEFDELWNSNDPGIDGKVENAP
jgi:uncharacterized protein YukE